MPNKSGICFMISVVPTGHKGETGIPWAFFWIYSFLTSEDSLALMLSWEGGPMRFWDSQGISDSALCPARTKENPKGNPVVQVDILAKVRYFQKLPKKPGLEKTSGSNAARLFAQDVDARLAGIVIWADGPYFYVFTRGP